MEGLKVSCFRERLSELISSSPKSQSVIASEFGVAKQTISAWLTGQSSPRAPVLTALSDYFDVSLPWLMGFDVPMRENKQKTAAWDEYISDVLDKTKIALPLSLDEEMLITEYRQLTPEGKEYVLRQPTAARAIYGIAGEKDNASSSSTVG